MKYTQRLIIICFLFLFLIACEKENKSPVIESITADSQTVIKGEIVQLICLATDEDNDQLSYSWASENGIFLNGNTGNSVFWKSPDEPGIYEMSVIISDGKNLIEGNIDITVTMEILEGNWVKMADFNGMARCEAVSVTVDGVPYVMFGYNDYEREFLDDIWRYDASVDNWIKVDADFPGVARTDAVGFAAEGKIYVGTGFNNDTDSYSDRLDDFWEFDPSTEVWTQKASFPGGAVQMAVAFSLNDKGYVGTGYSGQIEKDFYKYDPETDTWSAISGFGAKRSEAVAFVIDGEAYVCTGTQNGDFPYDFAKFNPESESWTTLNDIADTNDDESYDDEYNIARSNAVAFAVGGKGYVCTGGRNSGGSTVWEYTPAIDRWEEKTEFEGYSREGAIAFVVNGKGCVGLGSSATSLYFDDFYSFEPNAEKNDND